MGSEAGRWLVALERDERARTAAGGVGRVLGNIEVLVEDASGAWVEAGSAGETGPIASDTRIVPLPPGGDTKLRVRLVLTKGLWRLDQAAIASVVGEARPVRIRPTAVTRAGEPDPGALEALTDPERTLVTMPGDELEVSYLLPERPADHELFLEATGYYLEWMREEWMAEENPLAAAAMVLDPAGAMRSLAPAFKEVEPEIEHLF